MPRPSADFRNDRLGRDVRGLPCFRVGRALTQPEKIRLLRLAQDLDLYLSPATLEEAAAALVLPLKAVRVSRDGGAVSDAVAAQYAEALAGLPRRAMEDARRALNRDEAPGIDRKFLPTPTELAHLVKEFAAAAEFERRWIDHILALKEGPPEAADNPIVAAAASQIAAAAVTTLRQSFAEGSLAEREAAITRIADLERVRREREERVAADLARRRALREAAEAGTDFPADVEAPGEVPMTG